MIKPDEVKSAAQELEEENNEFSVFVQNNVDGDELDEQFLLLHNELFANYDCCKCTNCCKIYTVVVGDEELSRIAAFLKMEESKVISTYLERAEYIDPKLHRIRVMPCSFLLDDGRCRIYECRPDDCINYPLTNKPNRLSHMTSIITIAGVCPIVFEILERLKVIYEFQK